MKKRILLTADWFYWYQGNLSNQRFINTIVDGVSTKISAGFKPVPLVLLMYIEVYSF
jgi:hypothetical protein